MASIPALGHSKQMAEILLHWKHGVAQVEAIPAAAAAVEGAEPNGLKAFGLGAIVTQLDFAIAVLKSLIPVGVAVGAVTPIMIWLERRGSAWMQNRLGPNRIGPLGLFQTLADGIKMAFKEDFNAAHVKKFYYPAAPVISLIPALLAVCVIPFAAPIVINGTTYTFQVADLDVGVLFILAVVSLGIYGIILGGWSSNNKYSLLGSLRSSSQMISYELSMGLALVAVLMVYDSVALGRNRGPARRCSGDHWAG